MKSLLILPAKGCRRSRAVLKYLDDYRIPYQRIELDSDEGRRLAEQYQLRASPGIILNGVSLNPMELLIPPHCRVNEDKAREWFGIKNENKSNEHLEKE
ncbi:hypothetical protein [Bellilinea sp.]|uniref:Glutaredoxin n=1 Tax=Bellilinea caldifistulae TaxID=360411 RepID=A0A7C4Q2B4_9CHLR